jgi:hypothetical protein
LIALLAVLDFFALAFLAYVLRAAFSHACRLCLFFFFLQALRALLSFSMRICSAVFRFTAAGGGAGLPGPLKVALAGAPKIDGCGVGAALQESPVSHGGD